MKSTLRRLLLAAAPLLFLATGCVSQDPLYSSHWNVGSLRWRTEYNLFGYNSWRGSSLMEHQRDSAQSIALTVRRHFLNDNPENPLQFRRGWGGDTVYNPTAIFADTYYIVREGVVVGLEGVALAVLIPVDLVAGPITSLFGANYESAYFGIKGTPDPDDLDEFEIQNPDQIQ